MIPEAAVEAAASALRDAFDWGVSGFDEQARKALEAAAPLLVAEDPRIDAIAAWCGRHRSGYYDEAQDDVMALLRTTK